MYNQHLINDIKFNNGLISFLLHFAVPFMLPRMQVDKGAIRFVLSGANIMCPGLTSPGAKMTRLEPDKVVAVMAEGKEHAVAVGMTKMSSDEM